MLSNITYEELEAKIRKGTDIEDIAKEFSWQDFEGIVSEAFSANAFRTFRNFRFSSNNFLNISGLARPFRLAMAFPIKNCKALVFPFL